MNTYAYDNHLPCRNPNCKSHGVPHPNCKCYSHLATGGDPSFCSQDRAHDIACEYYSGGGLVPASDLPTESTLVPDSDIPNQTASSETKGTEVPPEDLPSSVAQFETPIEQVKAGLEGAAQGFAGPLATLAETHILGVDPQDIAKRAEANPWTHSLAEMTGLVGGMLTGTGEAALIGKGVGKLIPAAVPYLGKIGSTIIRGAIESGALQSADEISHAMLGQGDPEAPAAMAMLHIGGAALLGAVTGGAAGTAREGLKKIGEKKVGLKIESFLAGMGAAHVQPKTYWQASLDQSSFKAGQKFVTEGLPELIEKGVTKVSGGIGATAGAHVDPLFGTYAGYKVGEIVGKYLEKPLGRPLTGVANKYAAPAALQALKAGDYTGIFGLLDHAANVSKGAQKLNNGIESLFKYGGQAFVESQALEANREKLRKFIENGDQNQQIMNDFSQSQSSQDVQGAQGFADGGVVEHQAMMPPPPPGQSSFMNSNPAVTQHYPEQSMIMTAAKGRINNYLNSVRPQKNVNKLPFDRDIPNKKAEREYDKVLDMANQPLSILSSIKNGSLTMDQMKHFTNLYPELYNQLGKKITQKITQLQVSDERPPYKLRKTLSLFLNAPLDSSMTPMAIQAAQAVFAKQKMQSQGQTPAQSPKKGTAPLSKMPGNYMTSSQARETRQNKI